MASQDADGPQERATSRYRKIIEASQTLARVRSLPDLLHLFLDLAQEELTAEGASILLYDPARNVLTLTLALNERAEAADRIRTQGLTLAMGEGVAGAVAQARASLIVNDAPADSRFCRRADRITGCSTRNLLSSPILYMGELLGVVQVVNAKGREGFAPEDRDLLEILASLAAVALVRARMLDTQVAQERMQAELDAAARIQRHFLPELPDWGGSSRIWARTAPARSVGGDFYDCIPLKDGSFLTCVADVSGKGLPAALVGSALWAQLRGVADESRNPAAVLEALGVRMAPVLAPMLFATLAVCRYWPGTGRGILSSAGHPPCLLARSGSLRAVEDGIGTPLGVEDAPAYEDAPFSLEAGEALLLYTDGVTDARDRARRMYGEERLKEHLLTHPGPPWGESLIRSVEAFCAGQEPNDDLTVMEIWRT